ncbi:GDP-fucose synthetase [Candidatus Peribacteria bacterium RIFOXYC2_FULL_55_14]|nr:MAG: GDP-fucose synthetase [Candidatus Peribacteria bacterium RIFOXYA1_FULL_56_14]OGJ74462.1 MAG: GDP-fucose synthetase [Candidatus Peribacteria bacterium RIFOXYA2_FULL_55_28]OGJ75667.1 MAG: GDP-fucose synthetase [Candidatus Peribacteria bacterium RIFOXYB1_FULL_54_35]OGJ76609.1 MAG: GDP-fucose synthetase [Candidatus Peribacteria bacterium RIFOXYB2_FULL_54_17]OGJ76890.1 MAG: GDP-fucose synthetase [Candidatus Peribacteria bacterium RIFOXYC1_FULL_54_13]OGJ80269.1 MAG: GDP-fucose synthetase [Ca
MERDARIYIAGHSGMVGSALLRLLESEGYRSIITRDHSTLDLTDVQETQAFFLETKPQYVFFAAGKVGGILANTLQPTEFLTENIAMQNTVLLSARDAGVQKLLFFGSACIYPRQAQQPIAEEALLSNTLEPSNQAYAIAKISGILLCQALRKQHGCNFISVMPTNMYGPNDNFDLRTSHVIPALMRKIHEAKISNAPSVDIWGSGFATRDFLYVDDCASACLHLMRCYNSPEIINIGTGEEVGIRTLAETICTVVGYRGRLEFDDSKLEGVSRRYLDVRKIRTLGWQHTYTLREGLEKTYEWYREHILSHCNETATLLQS